MPSMLSSGIPSVRRSSSSVFCTGSPAEPGDAVERRRRCPPPGTFDRVELDRVPVPGRADRERALHREHGLVLNGSSSTRPLTAKLRRRHRRLGDGSVDVDVLPLEPSRSTVVAEDARRAPFVSVAAGPSWTSAPSMPTKRWRPSGATAAASNARFWRTPCVGLVGRKASGHRQVAEERPVERVPPHPRRDPASRRSPRR